jgi:hypothetical protein
VDGRGKGMSESKFSRVVGSKSIPLTIERLKDVLHYEKDTGIFRWRKRISCHMHIGSIAGTLVGGYIHIMIDKRQYGAHRLAMMYETGAYPENEVDHIDGRKTNNRFANLRQATRSMNAQNIRRALASNKSTGVLGVSMHRQTGKYRALIWVDGANRSLGLYGTVEEASAAYLDAKRRFHPGCTL